MKRRPDGGLGIDRNRPVPFRFDGQALEGYDGDTLASALLGAGVRLVGRSFKYHRPRGVFTAGSHEPNALVECASAGIHYPNVRATVQELYPGLAARSQNCWPSVRHDLMAINDRLSRFIGAGFYYKTFMWPQRFWESLYEPAIRRAAGLGRLPRQAEDAGYEQAFAFCDVLVIGSGPAGLAAALEAARSGADVILAEEDRQPGGRLLSDFGEIDGEPAHAWAASVVAELRGMANVRLMTRTTVVGAYDGGVFGALERTGLHLADPGDLPRETFWRITARQAVLATGALERPIAHPDNDRPGVQQLDAVMTYWRRYGVDPGRLVVFANNDTARRHARQLAADGVDIVACVDARPGMSARHAPEHSLAEPFPVFSGAQVIGTRGRHGLREVSIIQDGRIERVAADTLALSGGFNPTLHLCCHTNAKPVWNEAIAAFVPTEGMLPGLEPCGAARGIFSTAACLADGARAARAALTQLGLEPAMSPIPAAPDETDAITPLWQVSLPGRRTPRAWLDFANDVTTKDVQLAGQEGYASVEHMKRYTTQGMAPDQGKSSNVAALAVLADATGRSIPDTGTTTFRPPFVPVSIAAIGGSGRGQGFAPRRLTTTHAQSLQRGAPMIEAGLWYRPSYYPLPGEQGWRESCDREVAMVRNTVGICDVSTLGKIAVQGPDAARFLNLVYSNTPSTLQPGKVRYGLMLREDGHVMDDGTCARLGPQQFLVITTTAAAGEVLRHLDFVQQAFCRDWQLAFISVTEQWAQFAIAGPHAIRVLQDVLDAGTDVAGLGFMAHCPVSVSGVSARLFRISFSGERGYELAVPARYGAALFERLLTAAERHGGGPYGLEALNVLRIEKGFITHAEIDGRVTAGDLGLGRLVSAAKDCIGRPASRRPGLTDPERHRLVGLKPLDPAAALSAGAHLYAAGSPATAGHGEGHVTSVCYSPTLSSFIALGLLKNGPARHGEVIRLVDGLRSRSVDVLVCDPVFYDPAGERLRE